MTTRTFKQRGQAHGSVPVELVAKINGIEVFNGVVPTLNSPYQLTGFDQDLDSLTLGDELFSWTDNVTFNGVKTLEITVNNGFLVLMNTVANYLWLNEENAENTWSYVYFNEVEEVINTNPWSNMHISGQAQNPNLEFAGQTYWLIPPGGVLTCSINITASKLPRILESTGPG